MEVNTKKSAELISQFFKSALFCLFLAIIKNMSINLMGEKLYFLYIARISVPDMGKSRKIFPNQSLQNYVRRRIVLSGGICLRDHRISIHHEENLCHWNAY